MTITTTILLWVCRILFTGFGLSCWFYLPLVAGYHFQVTEKTIAEDGTTVWRTRKPTYLERQKAFWYDRMGFCVQGVAIIGCLSIIIAVLLWLNL